MLQEIRWLWHFPWCSVATWAASSSSQRLRTHGALVQACSERLRNMPQNADPYPVELNTEEDPEWAYLHENILMRVPKKDWK